MGVLPGIIGSMQAAEVIKLITGIGELLSGKLLLFDALDMRADTVRVSKKDSCPVCGTKPSIHILQDYEAWCGSRIGEDFGLPATPYDISPEDLKQLMDANPAVLLLDVREEFERQISALSGSVHIPLPELMERQNTLPHDRPIVAYCRNGVRSQEAARLLTAAGFADARHLVGGINAWAEKVDPTIPVY
jgi:adenylyltransferase/sulfurtransferase